MTTQAQIFAKQYAENVAAEALTNIKGIGKKAGRITGIALAISTPHQIGYILGLAPLRFDANVRHWLESLTVLALALLLPVANDYLIVICVRTLATKVASRTAKRTALGVMALPVLLGGAVNIAAPAPWQIRVLAGAVVLLIPAAEVLRTVVQRPDFRQIEAAETEVASQLPAREVRRCAPDCSCKRHARNRPAVEQPIVAPEPVHVIAPPRPRTRRPTGRRIGAVAPGWMSPNVRLAVANAR